jgi:hypothetical protein
VVSWLGWRWAGQLGRDDDDAAVPSMAWLDRSVAPSCRLLTRSYHTQALHYQRKE